MYTSIQSKRLLKYAGIPIVIALVLYLIWDGSNGLGTGEILAGICLVLFIGAMTYLRQSDITADRDIAQRIKAEYSTESQPQVFEIYNHLKTKEIEYLFSKVLDEAKGDVKEVKKLAGIAESVGWKSFLENHW